MGKKPKPSEMPLGHVVALATLDKLKGGLGEIFEHHLECRRALEDFVFWHITDRHPECPSHDDPEHTMLCCVWKRAKAALLQVDLNALADHPCSGKKAP